MSPEEGFEQVIEDSQASSYFTMGSLSCPKLPLDEETISSQPG